MAEADKNSKIKSLSLTASRLFSAICLKPSWEATNSLSIGKDQFFYINLASFPYPVQTYKNRPSSDEKKEGAEHVEGGYTRA